MSFYFKKFRNALSFSWGVLFLFVFCNSSYALSLGNLNVLSDPNAPFEARISLQLSDAEFQTLGPIDVVEAQTSVYQKLGIRKNQNAPAFSLSWVKNSAGKPTHVLIQTTKPLTSADGLFQDLIVELKWSSGLMRRAYTVLSDRSKEIKVNSGENLSQLANRLMPEMDGATFDQTLISLYRANPNAFFAGNIHRLKVGQSLRVPSPAMANSIPQSEAIRVIAGADRSLNEGTLDQSSEGVYVPINEALGNSVKEKSIQETRDRLKVGSSMLESDEQIEKTKRIEELVAQEKMLADAKKRIEELEKNIADLKKSIEKSSNAAGLSTNSGWSSLALSSGLVLLTVLFIFFLVRKNRAEDTLITKPSYSGSIKVSGPASNNSVSDRVIDPHVGTHSEPLSGEIPEFAQKLFSGIDLNLESSVAKGKGIESHKLLSSAEQRVKLNLAKSYLKIDDSSTAKLILQEIAQLGDRGLPEVVSEARLLLVQINSNS